MSNLILKRQPDTRPEEEFCLWLDMSGYYGSGYYAPEPYLYAPAPMYAPAPIYVQRLPRSYYGGSCWVATDTSRGYGYYGPCY